MHENSTSCSDYSPDMLELVEASADTAESRIMPTKLPTCCNILVFQ